MDFSGVTILMIVSSGMGRLPFLFFCERTVRIVRRACQGRWYHAQFSLPVLD
jgi:hypothetical protein